MSRSPITCHVLDASIGKPAEGVEVSLWRVPDTSTSSDEITDLTLVAKGVTNSDGRCTDLLPPRGSVDAGKAKTDPEAGQEYKIIFKTSQYFERGGRKTFYPRVEIFFTIENPAEHYHIPLLISPYSYTTYRGS